MLVLWFREFSATMHAFLAIYFCCIYCALIKIDCISLLNQTKQKRKRKKREIWLNEAKRFDQFKVQSVHSHWKFHHRISRGQTGVFMQHIPWHDVMQLRNTTGKCIRLHIDHNMQFSTIHIKLPTVLCWLAANACLSQSNLISKQYLKQTHAILSHYSSSNDVN